MIDEHTLGFWLENDYAHGWPNLALTSAGDERLDWSFSGGLEDLVDLHVETTVEHYPWSRDLALGPAMSERVEAINRLVAETNDAARRGDLEKTRQNYCRAGELMNDIPYDYDVLVARAEKREGE